MIQALESSEELLLRAMARFGELDRDDWAEQSLLLTVLGRLERTLVLDFLLAVAAEADDPRVVRCAVGAVCQDGGRGWRPDYERLCRRIEALDTTWTHPLSRDGACSSALFERILDEVADSSNPAIMRRSLLGAVEQMFHRDGSRRYDERILLELEALALRSPDDAELRRCAARALGGPQTLERPADDPVFLRAQRILEVMLADEDPKVRREACLGIELPAIAAGFREMVATDPDRRVRAAAAQRLRLCINEAGTIAFVIDRFEREPESTVRKGLLMAFYSLGRDFDHVRAELNRLRAHETDAAVLRELNRTLIYIDRIEETLREQR